MPSERSRHGETHPREFGQLRSYLARQGVKQAQIKAVVGTGAQGRSRGESVDLLRAWMRTLPQARTVRGTLRDEGVRAAVRVAGANTAMRVRMARARTAFGFGRVVTRSSAAVDRAMDGIVARVGRRPRDGGW